MLSFSMLKGQALGIFGEIAGQSSTIYLGSWRGNLALTRLKVKLIKRLISILIADFVEISSVDKVKDMDYPKIN